MTDFRFFLVAFLFLSQTLRKVWIKTPIILVVLAFAGSGFVSCSNDPDEVKRVMDSEAIMTERAFDVEILFSDSAIVRAKIQAPLMVSSLDRKNPERDGRHGFDQLRFNKDDGQISHSR